MVPLILSWILTVCALLYAIFGGGRYTQVKLMRRLFKNKGTPPAEALNKTRVIKDVDYLSVFPLGNLDVYTAKSATKAQPVLLWVHGGGYVGGDKSCIKAWAHVIAAELNMAVVSINYSLAPEWRYPVPIVQIGEAIKYLTENADRYNLDASRIFLGGDSAGAQMASQFAAIVYNGNLRAKTRIAPHISPENLRGIVLCCGFYDFDTVLKTRFPAIKTFIRAYTDVKNLKKCAYINELSPIKHLSDGYCDVYITCGNSDPFITQAREFADKLSKSGICTDAYFPAVKGKRLGHEYQFLIGKPCADTALERAVRFIEKLL